MRVGIYARVSTTKQDLENQLSELREFCNRNNWTIHKEYTDFGISGDSKDREGLEQALTDAHKKLYDILLFWSLDRLSRGGTRDTINLLYQLDDWGISYKSYQEQYIDSMGMFKDVVISIISTLAKVCGSQPVSTRVCHGQP